MLRYIFRFAEDVGKQMELAGIPKEEQKAAFFTHAASVNQFIADATGSSGCNVHIAGGAIFWFTIMTTM